ncbi:MAG: N-acetylmuramoyl-L-alanine amidase [Aerococcus urinaeequi]
MNYRKDHIPRNTPNGRRPGNSMDATTITIHNTGNEKSTAANERGWLTNPTNQREASFHIAVDDREAVECIPLNENAWHAGDGKNGPGNRKSIGIEICESGDYAKTLDNAATLVAAMLKERGWSTDKLRRHYDWSGKICPRLMYDGGKWTGWDQFKQLVYVKLRGETNKVDKATAIVNGVKIEDAIIVGGRAYIPLRSAGDNIKGAVIDWDNKTKVAKLDTQGGK